MPGVLGGNITFSSGLRRWGWLLAAAVALLLAAGLLAKPVWRKLRDYRAAKFAAQALAAQQATNWPGSVANLRAAVSLNPVLPAVLRALAEHHTRLGLREGLGYWEQLDAAGGLTHADRLRFARLALDTRALPVARKAIVALGKTHPDDPDVLSLLAELFFQAGEPEPARRTAWEAFNAAPEREDLALQANALDLLAGDEAVRAAARSRLFSLAVAGGPQAGEAGYRLLLHGQLDAGQTAILARVLRQIPAADLTGRVVRLAIEIRAHPGQAAELTRRWLEETPLDPGSPGFRQALAQLQALGEHAAVVALVPEPQAVADPDYALARFDALAFQKDADGIESLLRLGSNRIPASLGSLYRALAAELAGRTNEVATLWELCLAANTRNRENLEIIATRAEAAGALATAVAAWETLLLETAEAPRAAAQLLRLGLGGARRDLRPAHAAYAKLARMHPERADLQLEHAFLGLWLHQDVAGCRQTVERVRPEAAGSPLFAVTEALLLLREGDPDRGLGVLEPLGLDWTQAPETWRAVRVAALGLAGQSSLARRDAQTLLDRQRLSDAELALVEPWLPQPGR